MTSPRHTSLLSLIGLVCALTLAAGCSSTTSEAKSTAKTTAAKDNGTPNCTSEATKKLLTYCVSPSAAEYAQQIDDMRKKMAGGSVPLDVFPLPVKGAHVEGPADAAVTVVVFSDLQCPSCKVFHETLEALKKKHPKDIRVAFRHYPLPQHPMGKPAAIAAMAADEQGKFWAFTTAAFAKQDQLSEATFEAIIKEVGGDVEKFKKSYKDAKHQARLKADMKMGESLGLSHTPFAYINGVQLPPQALSVEMLGEFIEGQKKIAAAFKGAGVPANEIYWRIVRAQFDERALAQAKARAEEERRNRIPVYIPTEDSPRKGAADDSALVTIVEFSDFECPFCSRANEPLHKVIADHKGEVRLVFKHMPLPFHKRAAYASAASIVAGKQGKFWEMHDLLFDNQNALEDDDIKQYAAKLKLKGDVLKDMRADAVGATIQRDMKLAEQHGVNGTPTLFVNGRRIPGVLPYETLKVLVTEEIALAKKLQAAKKLKGEALYKAVVEQKKAELAK